VLGTSMKRPVLFDSLMIQISGCKWFSWCMRIPMHFGQQSDFSRTAIRFNSDTRPI
jgi:hypothetical protein